MEREINRPGSIYSELPDEAFLRPLQLRDILSPAMYRLKASRSQNKRKLTFRHAQDVVNTATFMTALCKQRGYPNDIAWLITEKQIADRR